MLVLKVVLLIVVVAGIYGILDGKHKQRNHGRCDYAASGKELGSMEKILAQISKCEQKRLNAREFGDGSCWAYSGSCLSLSG